VATVALGAVLGGGLGLLAATHSDGGSSAGGGGTTLPGLGLTIPQGLIAGRAASPPPIHSIDNRVFIVGDSVMQGAAPYLGDLLDGWSIIADTRVGRFIDEANRVIEKRHGDIGQIAVLNLGNNYNGDRAAFARQVDVALGQLAAVPHVIWIDVAEFEDDRAEVNDTLHAAARTHPNLTVVDWNSWWEKDRSLTGADHLHLTPKGAEAYASLVASAVSEVTEAAGEIPAPGAKPPRLNTSGRIPSSSGASSGRSSTRSPSRSSRHSSSHHTPATTAPPPVSAAPPPGPATTEPPAPATTEPPAPATTEPPAGGSPTH
jgi:hypothetical protein